MNTHARGILIAIEGIDGAGKSTLARALYIALTEKGIPAVLTKEPGGTELGAHIRTLLMRQSTPIYSKTEYLLFAADRAQHFYEIIEPSLNQGYIVVSDRLSDSSLVYQGAGRGLDVSMLDSINKWTMNHIVPDLTIYMQLSLTNAIKRLYERPELSSFEKEIPFMEQVIKGFDQLYQDRNDVLTLKSTDNPESLVQQTILYINKHKQLTI